MSLIEQNPWWRDSILIDTSKEISRLHESAVQWDPRIRYSFDLDSGIIYTLRGPRQVGKTTLIKLMIKELLDNGTEPRRILYYSCDLVPNPSRLAEIISEFLDVSQRHSETTRYIFLDEISAVPDWQRGIKHLYDLGRLNRVTVVMTGSHNLDIRRAAERLPGRRGDSASPSWDKILVPMKFSEYLETRDKEIDKLFQSLHLRELKKRVTIITDLQKGIIPDEVKELNLYLGALSRYFREYLLTGGVVRAVNDFIQEGKIMEGTYATYVDATIGDILRWGKRESYLVQLIRRLNETLCSQVSWNNLRENTDIGSANTVSEYVDVLASSFVLYPTYCLDRSKGGPNYSKNKKIHYSDPFIFHALRAWVKQVPAYDEAQQFIAGKESTKLVECVVGNHLIRLAYMLNPVANFNPYSHVFYWKDSKGEVDFVLKQNQSYMPFEVKQTSSFSRKDVNGLYRFSRGVSDYQGVMVTRDMLMAEKSVTAVPAPLLLALI